MVLKSNIGSRRHYITVESATRTSDGQGGWTSAWATLASEWVRAVPLSMSRVLDQGGMKYTKAVEFTMRRRDDTPTDLYTLSGEHRINWDGTYYTIHSVVANERGDDLIILAYA